MIIRDVLYVRRSVGTGRTAVPSPRHSAPFARRSVGDISMLYQWQKLETRIYLKDLKVKFVIVIDFFLSIILVTTNMQYALYK